MTAVKKEVLIPEGSAKPVAPYSPGIKAGQFVFASGQLGLDPNTGKLVEGIEAQTRQAMQNLQSVLAAGDSNLSLAVKVTIYLEDINDYGVVNEVYAGFIEGDPPARAAFQVAALPLGGLVEIEAIALSKG